MLSNEKIYLDKKIVTYVSQLFPLLTKAESKVGQSENKELQVCHIEHR